MKKIIPIKDLRNTVEIDRLVKENNEPIFVTKNGYSDLVIMSQEYYENLITKEKYIKQKFTNSFKEKEQLNEFGFVRVKTKRIDIDPANIDANKEAVIKEIDIASKENVDILLFQELTLCSSTLDDVIFFDPLINKCKSALKEIVDYSKSHNLLVVLGGPLLYENKLYNVAYSIFNGEIVSITPKNTNIGNFSTLNEDKIINYLNNEVNFGINNIIISNHFPSLRIGIEFGDDLLNSSSNVSLLTKNGANLILSLGAVNELLENQSLIRKSIEVISNKYKCCYCFVNTGYGESTGDTVYSNEQYVFENGELISEITPFEDKNNLIVDVDLDKINKIRLKSSFPYNLENCNLIGIDLKINLKNDLKRNYYKNPFLKDDKFIDLNKVKYILNIQANGLIKRLNAIHQKKVILGLSGGLDSTLALLVAYEAFKKLNYDPKDILCITMPAFGTTSKTKNNSHILANLLGVSIREINISDSVLQHLKDIGHDLSIKDVAYENAQARERTQVLMDIANKEGALQLGTGDLSEMCLGWCTYNGDQMSMYSINSSIPKTMVKYLCKGYALLYPTLNDVLEDIIGTPVSPELIPGKDGEISQKTEDIIGPYFLHDFFIYHFLRYSYSPKKLYYLAINTFKDEISKDEILKWLKVLIKRFFQNHFKRSASPDGIKISEISISKKDLDMPSDCSYNLFLKDLDNLDF